MLTAFPHGDQQLRLWRKWEEPGIAENDDLRENVREKMGIMYAAARGLLKFKRNMIEIKYEKLVKHIVFPSISC